MSATVRPTLSHFAAVALSAVAAGLVALTLAAPCLAQTAANRSLAAPVPARPRAAETPAEMSPASDAAAAAPTAEADRAVEEGGAVEASAPASAGAAEVAESPEKPDEAPAWQTLQHPRSDNPIERRRLDGRGESRPEAAEGEGGAGDSDPASQPSGLWTMVRTLGALAIVLGLIYALARLLKRWNTGSSAGSSGVIEVLARTPLTHRHGVTLVRVGSRVLVVGVAPESIAALGEITDPEEVAGILGAVQSRRRGSISGSFASALDEKQLDLELSQEAVEHMALDEPAAEDRHDAGSLSSAALDRLENLLGRVRGLGERRRGGQS